MGRRPSENVVWACRLPLSSDMPAWPGLRSARSGRWCWGGSGTVRRRSGRIPDEGDPESEPTVVLAIALRGQTAHRGFRRGPRRRPVLGATLGGPDEGFDQGGIVGDPLILAIEIGIGDARGLP